MLLAKVFGRALQILPAKSYDCHYCIQLTLSIEDDVLNENAVQPAKQHRLTEAPELRNRFPNQ